MPTTDWIQTYTGKKFFPLEPDIDLICIEDIAHSLSMQCRFNGHSKQFYSVAQHSVMMARNWFQKEPEMKLYALLHDASEAYLSDIPRPLKRLPQFNFYKDAEAALQSLIYIRFGLSPIEPDEVKRADNEILGEEAVSPVIMSSLHPDWHIKGKRGLSFFSWVPEFAEAQFLIEFSRVYANAAIASK